MSHVIHLGDCLDPATGLASLPDKSVDHVICDPPYEAEAHTKQQAGMRGGASSLSFDAITEKQRAAVGAHLGRLSRRWVLVFCQAEAIAAWRAALEAGGLRWVRACVWVKPDGMPQLTGDRPAQGYESIAVAHAPGAMKWNGAGQHGVWSVPKHDPERTGHETQKPIAIMEKLVRLFTDPGETILDPFAGSGTTLVAAKRLGRNAIGWERDERYAEIARKRIAKTAEQFGLFAEGA